MSTVECGTCGGSIESHQRDRRSNAPVGAERKAHACIAEGPEGVRGGTAVRADELLGPAAVVHKMVGLHRRDHSEISEAVKVRRLDVLCVLDTEAPCTATRRILAQNALKDVYTATQVRVAYDAE